MNKSFSLNFKITVCVYNNNDTGISTEELSIETFKIRISEVVINYTFSLKVGYLVRKKNRPRN